MLLKALFLAVGCGFKICHNGLQLGEVADLEVQMFNFCTNVN
jgi:hypothetical protein